jgi:hypothetical protein
VEATLSCPSDLSFTSVSLTAAVWAEIWGWKLDTTLVGVTGALADWDLAATTEEKEIRLGPGTIGSVREMLGKHLVSNPKVSSSAMDPTKVILSVLSRQYKSDLVPLSERSSHGLVDLDVLIVGSDNQVQARPGGTMGFQVG